MTTGDERVQRCGSLDLMSKNWECNPLPCTPHISCIATEFLCPHQDSNRDRLTTGCPNRFNTHPRLCLWLGTEVSPATSLVCLSHVLLSLCSVEERDLWVFIVYIISSFLAYTMLKVKKYRHGLKELTTSVLKWKVMHGSGCSAWLNETSISSLFRRV